MHNGHYFFFVSIVKTFVSFVVKHKSPFSTFFNHNGHYPKKRVIAIVSIVQSIVSIVVKHNPPYPPQIFVIKSVINRLNRWGSFGGVPSASCAWAKSRSA